MSENEEGMPTFHAIKAGMEWEDSKGFKWEVFENIYFGKWRVICRGRSDQRCNDGCRHDHCKGGASRVGEMFGNEIRSELRDEWKRNLKAAQKRNEAEPASSSGYR